MRLICTFFIGLMFVLPLSAQEKNKQSHQQIETVKIAFLTQKLNLNTSEAEKFWPIYNNYQKEMRELFKLRKDSRRDKQNDSRDNADGELDFESRILDTRKKYKTQFSKVLSPDKVGLFFQSEREFREQMIKELRERRGQ